MHINLKLVYYSVNFNVKSSTIYIYDCFNQYGNLIKEIKSIYKIIILYYLI